MSTMTRVWIGVSAVLAAALVVTAGFAFGWWGGGGGAAEPGASPEPTETAGEQTSAFVPRDVTTGDTLPDFEALTADALQSVDSGWVSAVYRGSYEEEGTFTYIDGPSVVLLISPTGERYQVADVTAMGDVEMLAWDYARGKALLVDRLTGLLATLDYATGEMGVPFNDCGDMSYATATVREGAWLVRGYCGEGALDGLVGDDGEPLDSSGVVLGGNGLSVTDVGATQVQFDFEAQPDEKFKAIAPDGTVTPLFLPFDEADCYPFAPAGDAIVIECFGGTGTDSLWRMPVDGSEGFKVADQTTFQDVSDLSGGGLAVEDLAFVSYCEADGAPLLGLGSTVVTFVEDIGYVFTPESETATFACHGASGSTALLNGPGSLWTWDIDTGDAVSLVTTPDGFPGGYILGAGSFGAFIVP